LLFFFFFFFFFFFLKKITKNQFPEDLIRIYIRYNRIKEAAAFTIRILSKVSITFNQNIVLYIYIFIVNIYYKFY